MEKNLATMAKGGLKLHPNTVKGMSGNDRSVIKILPKFYILIIIVLLSLLLAN
jgi:hypothetical protein